MAGSCAAVTFFAQCLERIFFNMLSLSKRRSSLSENWNNSFSSFSLNTGCLFHPQQQQPTSLQSNAEESNMMTAYQQDSYNHTPAMFAPPSSVAQVTQEQPSYNYDSYDQMGGAPVEVGCCCYFCLVLGWVCFNYFGCILRSSWIDCDMNIYFRGG